MITVTQHYDKLAAVGAQSKSNLILLPNAPDAAGKMLTNTMSSFLEAAKVAEMDANEKQKAWSSLGTIPGSGFLLRGRVQESRKYKMMRGSMENKFTSRKSQF